MKISEAAPIILSGSLGLGQVDQAHRLLFGVPKNQDVVVARYDIQDSFSF